VAPAPPPAPAPARPPAPLERELHVVATIDAIQNWKKNDPEHPGDQWSKGKATQRFEMRTRLRSDGRIEVRNILDLDLQTRMEAKTIHLARQAKKYFEASGQPFKLPHTPEEIAQFQREMNGRLLACNAEATCYTDTQMQYAAITAAIDNPQVLEDDDEPGRYLYFLPYKGCPEYSRVTLNMSVEGVRFNKDVKEFIPFKELHSADTLNADDGLALCRHFAGVIDTQDPQNPMFQETIFVPRPVGITEHTENDHTSRAEEPQPVITAVIDWMNMQLRHAPAQGTKTVELPLPLPLNQNATWLGLWTGTAKVTMEWSFTDVPVSAAPSSPAKPPSPAPKAP
jgi:hypothetical protein